MKLQTIVKRKEKKKLVLLHKEIKKGNVLLAYSTGKREKITSEL